MRKPEKAYKNIDFLRSREARTLRILAEYLEPEKRLKDNHVKHTVVFFGSSRVRPDADPNDPFHTHQYYWAAEELAFQLSNYAKDLKIELAAELGPDSQNGQAFAVCSGGGPGIMEAANRGASRAGAKNIGLNISIPTEQHHNPYISEELSFEFHYFFMRKLWFLYLAQAVIIFPGGFGTMDELFETLTLIQTGKEDLDIPILLYDPEFWHGLLNFDKLVDVGVIGKNDLDLLHFFSSPEEGMEFLKPRLKDAILNFVDND